MAFICFHGEARSEELPVLGNVKGPLELEMGVVVVIHELGDGVVVATGDHAGRSFFSIDCRSSAS